ncbi:Acyl-CoA-binding protein ACBP [Penicillium concentricum]|uniref:Acyl-CoA-binding protein ACBP n=1 Tax=Penicillium concentricum TaxID=293559 RepID=A0A9W9SQP2_9EURO|nr:Acyl-CoA-binding protein ACBP [Penicillium concentricum]KAJ5382365.1 Acyl-CoA-binding protein ACBP [Penicillium concentricum]
MSDSVDRVFVHALNTVKRIPRTGTARPPAAERLALYGLYKQSMEGDVEGVMDRPIGNTSEVHAECEKWDAWYAQRDMSRTEAKRRYISTLIDTMHQYASQTPEACELVAELEFVWDQIKYNAASSSDSPLNTVGVPPLSRSAYGSIGGRLAKSEEYDRPDRRDDASRRDRDSRLRVLSPVSQPEEEEYYRRRRGDLDNGEGGGRHNEDEDEDDEEFEEARDSLYEERDQDDHDNDDPDTSSNTHTNTEASSHRPKHRRNPASGISTNSSGTGLLPRRDSHSNSEPPKDSRWRRRVEQALTKMTAEIAAVREQMEARSVAQRRRSGFWAWLKWMIWVAVRQILFDIAMLGMLLIWMRLRGDRRVEQRLKTGWAAVKAKLATFKRLKIVDMPILP